MKYKKGVVLNQEPVYASFYEDVANITILTIKCPRCESCYRIPLITKTNESENKVPKYCPYCKKKLVEKSKK